MATFVFNLLGSKADVKDVEKVEVKQEKITEYMLEQRDMSTKQTVEIEYMKKLLEKIDKRMETSQ